MQIEEMLNFVEIRDILIISKCGGSQRNLHVLVFHVNKKRRYLIEKGREKYELKLFQSWEIKIQLSHCINT